MFEESARWYDALYSFKDYARESGEIISMLKQVHCKASTVLDVACGTAEHDKYLAEEYSVDGLDINADIASTKNPHGEYFCADMTDFTLAKTYDIVLCLFSSIGYVKKIDSLIEAFRCFGRHLNTDGIIVVEPWFTPDEWNPDCHVHLLTAETSEGKICRMNISEQEGSLAVVNFHYLVGTSAGVKHFTERHDSKDNGECFDLF
ncbi:MAG: class I SAM-dependent methyltransferase [Candidatus Aegiribacteria sp.]|nr:class I SAM-dependent methyltransferase [Candidatus Aegiribacteria sp.]